MIIDKDREWDYPSNQDISDATRIVDLMHDSEKPGYFVLSDELSKIRTESAEQARKEAAERAVAFVDQFDEDSQDGDFWTSADLRAVILNSPVKEGKTDAEKLTVAANALKSIYEMLKCDGVIRGR